MSLHTLLSLQCAPFCLAASGSFIWFGFHNLLLSWNGWCLFWNIFLRQCFRSKHSAFWNPDAASEAVDRAGCQIQTVEANPLVTECRTLMNWPFIGSWYEGLTVALNCWLLPLHVESSLIALSWWAISDKQLICWQTALGTPTHLIYSHPIPASYSRKGSSLEVIYTNLLDSFSKFFLFCQAGLKWSCCLLPPTWSQL